MLAEASSFAVLGSTRLHIGTVLPELAAFL